MKGECGGEQATQVRLETQQGRQARPRGLPEGGFGEALGLGAGGPRGAQQRPGGMRRRGLGPPRGSASPALGRALQQRPQGASGPGREQGAVTAGAGGRRGRGARTPELAGGEGRRHLRAGAPHAGRQRPAAVRPSSQRCGLGPRPGSRCPSWRRPLHRSPFRSMARPVTARRLRTGGQRLRLPPRPQKRARARPAPGRPRPRRRRAPAHWARSLPPARGQWGWEFGGGKEPRKRARAEGRRDAAGKMRPGPVGDANLEAWPGSFGFVRPEVAALEKVERALVGSSPAESEAPQSAGICLTFLVFKMG